MYSEEANPRVSGTDAVFRDCEKKLICMKSSIPGLSSPVGYLPPIPFIQIVYLGTELAITDNLELLAFPYFE